MHNTRPRGTYDLLSPEVEQWQQVEAQMRSLCQRFGYREVRTPIIEHTELFERGVGETTDVVEKEMYTFTDRGGRSLTLRPEGTAPTLRAFLENGLHGGPQPVKLFYLAAPMFRFERPQAGRFRQHYQFGLEALGSMDPALDAEIINAPLTLMQELGAGQFAVHLNSLGCQQCRPGHRQALAQYYEPVRENLCRDCQRRLDINPLRLLDCKNEQCQPFKGEAPKTIDYLCQQCDEHWQTLQGYLDALAVEYAIDPTIVRGLDYYTKTVFEVIDPNLGAQNTVCGGGRYDGLVAALGGPATPGIGFGLGLERLMAVLESRGVSPADEQALDLFIVTAGSAARNLAVPMLAQLRRLGVAADMDFMDRSLRAQMRRANRYPARAVIVLGDREIEEGRANLKMLATGAEREIVLDDLAAVAAQLNK